MKQIRNIIISLSLVVALTIIAALAVSHRKVDAKQLDCYSISNLSSIKLYWNKAKKANTYLVYRAVVKNNKYPKKRTFKVIAKTKKTYYLDKKVKKNKNYAYYIKIKNKKGKVIADNYKEREADCIHKGFGRPFVVHGGSAISKKQIRLFTGPDYSGYHTEKDNVVFYRRDGGKGKFSKIKPTRVEEDLWFDKKVEPGHTYEYYIKMYAKKGKKKVYSPKSKTEIIRAVNDNASYRIETLTKAGLYENTDRIEVEFKVANEDKYNGKTFFFANVNPNSDTKYFCKAYDEHGKDYNKQMRDEKHSYELALTQYSYDGTKWENITSAGIELPQTEPLYLKATVYINKNEIVDNPYINPSIYFAGSDSKFYQSNIQSSKGLLKYYGPTSIMTECDFYLRSGIGSVSAPEWDYS